MKHFVSITTEGFTFQPDFESIEPDIENCQVLGFELVKVKRKHLAVL